LPAVFFFWPSFVSAPPPTQGQAMPSGGQIIESVEWEGLRALTSETLEYYLGLREGAIFDPAELNRNLHALWERGLIDDLVVEAEDGPRGVRLRVQVEERAVLRSIEYQGFRRVSRSDVTERMDRERVRVREGLPIERGELERLQGLIEELYREKGFRFAQAGYTLEPVSPGEQRVVFTVDEGDRVRIQEIEFEGNEVFTDWRLRQAMRKTRESGPISRIFRRDIYSPANVQEDLDRIRDLYRERGYKNIVVEEPELEVRPLRPDARTVEGSKRRLFLTLPIEEGERWKLGEISIEGNEIFPDQVLMRAFQRPSGRGDWLRASAIEEGAEAVEEIYRNTGYIYSRVHVRLEERGDDIADVVVQVYEGEQYRVGRLTFQGNDRTRDKVLRREFRVQEGRVLNMGALRNSLFKLNQLGYFKLDEDNPIEFDNFDAETQTVDLVVRGEESDRTELLFGGGWSELDRFFGQFSVRTQNFLGRGETLAAAVQTGRLRDRYELSYFVPWLMDRPQSAGIQLFHDDFDFDLIEDQRQRQKITGGAVTYGRSYGLFHSVRLTYGLRDISSTFTLFDFLEGDVLSQELDYRRSSLMPMWIYDSQDNRLEPTRGLRSVVSVEYAGGPLGGSISLYRPEVSLSWYRPMTEGQFPTVFGAKLEGGLLEFLGGDQDLLISERYVRGGPRSIRGFSSRSLFLRDEDGVPIRDERGFLLGGTQFVESSLEYHVLLGGPFRLVFFADAGNVFGSPGPSISLDNLRYTAGAELRLFVPMFGLPLRFIYSRNLRPMPGDRFESFQFDVGVSF
jgi:outer membrane protein insertion porin family